MSDIATMRASTSEGRIYSREEILFLRKKMAGVPYLLPDGMEMLMVPGAWRSPECRKFPLPWKKQRSAQAFRSKEERKVVQLPTISEMVNGTELFTFASSVRRLVDPEKYENSWEIAYTKNREALIANGNRIKEMLNKLQESLPMFEDEERKNRQFGSNLGLRPLMDNSGTNRPNHAFSGRSGKETDIMNFWKTGNDCAVVARRSSDEENRIPPRGVQENKEVEKEEMTRKRSEKRRSSIFSLSDASYYTPRESPVSLDFESTTLNNLHEVSRYSINGAPSTSTFEEFGRTTPDSQQLTPKQSESPLEIDDDDDDLESARGTPELPPGLVIDHTKICPQEKPEPRTRPNGLLDPSWDYPAFPPGPNLEMERNKQEVARPPSNAFSQTSRDFPAYPPGLLTEARREERRFPEAFNQHRPAGELQTLRQHSSCSSQSSSGSQAYLPGLFTSVAKTMPKSNGSRSTSRRESSCSEEWTNPTSYPRQLIEEHQAPRHQMFHEPEASWRNYRRLPPRLSQNELRDIKFSQLFRYRLPKD